jgi:hypothetical protein
LVGVLAIWGTGVVFADETIPVRVKLAEPFQKWEVRIAVSATEVLVDQPLEVSAHLINATGVKQSIVVPREMRPYSRVAGEDGWKRQWFEIPELPMGPKRLELKVGESVSWNYRFELSRAGVHELKVEVLGVFEAEGIRIEVNEPEGMDRQAWLALQKLRSYQMFLRHGAAVDGNLIPLYERITTEFAPGVYAHHIALALGRHYRDESYRRGGGQGSEVEFREYQGRALRYFRQAAEMNQVPWVREEALLEWAKLVGGAEAVTICDRAQSEFPNSPLRPQFEQLRAAWQQELEREAARPRDAIARVEEELIAMGYDLSKLSDEQKHAINYDIIRATWDECEQRGLGNAECDDLLIRRYKAWATKNLKPTLPPKTDDTSTIVAPEVVP